jgi:hypothetical protein
VHRVLLAAAISPDNVTHGYNLTFAFPMLMFIIVATALFLRFRSAHRIPGHVPLSASRWAMAARPDTSAAQSTTNGSTLQGDGEETADEVPEDAAGENTEGSE